MQARVTKFLADEPAEPAVLALQRIDVAPQMGNREVSR